MLRTLKSDEETLRQTFLSDLVYRRDKTLKTASLDRINEDFHYGLRPGNFCFGILKLDGHVFDDMENLRFMADKVRGVMNRLLPECTFDYELLVAGSFFYFLLNFEESMRSQVRRQMKALFDEVRIQGGILKDFAATLSLGTVCGGLDGLDSSLKNARLLIEERLVAGTGKLLEGELPPEGLLRGQRPVRGVQQPHVPGPGKPGRALRSGGPATAQKPDAGLPRHHRPRTAADDQGGLQPLSLLYEELPHPHRGRFSGKLQPGGRTTALPPRSSSIT